MQEKSRVNLILVGVVIFETLILGFIVVKVYLGASGLHFPL